MPSPTGVIDIGVEQRLSVLEASIAALEQRLQAVESRPAQAIPAQLETTAAAPVPVGVSRGDRTAHGFDVASVLSLSGRTLMVLGGAFLLRALTDTGRVPHGTGIVLGLAYAIAWLVATHRAAARDRRLSAVFHGVAAIVIGYPLLWEATTRFAFLGAAASASAVGVFTAVALGVAWRARLQTVAGVASLTAMATALALSSSTGEVAPYALLLILLGVATLWLGYDRDWYWPRWPAALVADVMIVGLVTRAARTPPLERPDVTIAFALLLLAAYLGSFAARTLVRGRLLIPFEVIQTMAALAVGLGGALVVAHAASAGEAPLGASCVALGAGCYAVAFAFVQRRHGLGANFYFYATLALVLTLVGGATILSAPAFAILSAALAVVTTWLAHRQSRLALAAHGAVYVVAGAVASGTLSSALGALAGAVSAQPAMLTPASTVLVMAALLCMGVPRPAQTEAPPAFASIPRLAIALVVVTGLGGMLVQTLAMLFAGTPADPGVVATLRTAVIAGAAVALALATRYDALAEAGWLLYPVLGLGALKLLLEDFRRSETTTLFIALAVFGAALVVAPRLVRRAARRAPA